MTSTPVVQQRRGRALALLFATGTLGLPGMAVLIAPAAGAATITSGNLDWEIREDFVEHIATVGCPKGGHPNFEASAPATINGGSTPTGFTYGNATGSSDSATAFTVQYQGNVRFAYCGGIRYDIGKPKIVVNGTQAQILVDAQRTSGGGTVTDSATAVAIANLNLSGITPQLTGDNITYSNVPAVLVYSEELNDALGTFPDGWQNGGEDPTTGEPIPADQSMAPVTFSFFTGAPGSTPAPTPTPTSTPTPTPSPAPTPTPNPDAPGDDDDSDNGIDPLPQTGIADESSASVVKPLTPIDGDTVAVGVSGTQDNGTGGGLALFGVASLAALVMALTASVILRYQRKDTG